MELQELKRIKEEKQDIKEKGEGQLTTYNKDIKRVEDVISFGRNQVFEAATDILKHQTSSSVSSGDLFQILNNSTKVFSVDYQGAVHLKPRTSAPTDNSEGTVYYDSSQGSLLVSVEV